MSYTVTYTETNVTNKTPITVDDETLNNATSLVFVGKNYAGYGKYIANNFLHLLENFSSPTAPTNPIQGQLWYDNVNNQLMVNNDGTLTNWTTASSVQKSISKPSVANTGDIWVDTINQQLYIYKAGTAWTLVGPLLSQGTVTGQDIEEVIDTTGNVKHNIVNLYSSDTRIAVISSDTFTPQKTIAGFTTIQAGITLNNTPLSAGGTTPKYKFNGVATDADKLGGVSSLKYVRTDIENTMSLNLNVLSLKTGNDYNFAIGSDPLDSSNYLITSKSAEKSIEVKVQSTLYGSRTVAYFDPSQRVGIATKTPSATLDVNGSLSVSSTSGKLLVNGTGDVSTSGVQTASLQTNGGLYVSKSVMIGTNSPTSTSTKHNLVISNGSLILNYLDVTSIPPSETSGAVILPGYQTHELISGAYVEKNPPYYDIGSDTHRFRRFYVSDFVGNVIGNVTGDLTGNVNGNVSGSAGKLSTSSNFKLDGDVTSNTVGFNGDGSAVTFETNLSPLAISDKTELSDSTLTDEFLVYRQYAALTSGYIDGTTLILGSIEYGKNSIAPGMTVIGMDSNNNSVLTGTVIVREDIPDGVPPGYVGSKTRWIIDKTQTIGSQVSPIIIHIGTNTLYKTSKQTFVDNISIVRVGSILLYPGTNLPQGYKFCDGTAYRISQYADLYSILGETYLVPGDSTSFVVPTLTGPNSSIKYIIYTGVF